MEAPAAPGMLDTSADVCAWLRGLGLDAAAEVCEREDIDGRVLLALLDEDRGLEEGLGVTHPVHRAKIRAGVVGRCVDGAGSAGQRRATLLDAPASKRMRCGASARSATVDDASAAAEPAPALVVDTGPPPDNQVLVYVSRPPTNLKCIICLREVMEDPTSPRGGCTHTLCRTCWIRCLRKKSECPKCRQAVPVQGTPEQQVVRNTDMCGIAAEQMVYCPEGVCDDGDGGFVVDPSGCTAKLTVTDVQRHLTTCGHVRVDCCGAEHGCTWESKRQNIAAHEAACVYVQLSGHLSKFAQLEAALAKSVEAQRQMVCERRIVAILQQRREWQLRPLPGFEMRWPLPKRERFVNGFTARVSFTNAAGPDLVCGIPGTIGSKWEGGVYPASVEFPPTYPMKPPRIKLPKGFFAVNVYPSGTVSTSVLNDDVDWEPSITVKEFLVAVRHTLENPNINSPAQAEAYRVCTSNTDEFESRVREQARKHSLEKFCADHPADNADLLSFPQNTFGVMSDPTDGTFTVGVVRPATSTAQRVIRPEDSSASWKGVRALPTVAG
jgi:ubiquitin-conjugating enzyme E2 I